MIRAGGQRKKKVKAVIEVERQHSANAVYQLFMFKLALIFLHFDIHILYQVNFTIMILFNSPLKTPGDIDPA